MSLQDTIGAAINGVAAGVTSKQEAQEMVTAGVCNMLNMVFANLDVHTLGQLHQQYGVCFEAADGQISRVLFEV